MLYTTDDAKALSYALWDAEATNGALVPLALLFPPTAFAKAIVDIQSRTRPGAVWDERNQTHVAVAPGGFSWEARQSLSLSLSRSCGGGGGAERTD